MRPDKKRAWHVHSLVERTPRRAWFFYSLLLVAPLLLLGWLHAEESAPSAPAKQWDAKSDLYQSLSSAKPISEVDPLTAEQLEIGRAHV